MFTLGLVSSLHCVQMCGPIVLSYSVALESLKKAAPSGSSIPSQLQNHLTYNAGRILTYSALGAIAGVAGGTLGLLGSLAGVSHLLAITSGGLMFVVGISMLGILPSSVLGSSLFRVPSLFLRRIGKLLSAPGAGNRFVLGLALGMLPCGLIYAALLKAMATGSVIAGTGTMLAFGLGTASALLAIGMFSSAIRMRLNRWGSQLAAVGVTLMGVVLVWRGTMPGMLMLGGHVHVHH
jgi:sulfite exporter TauE/SafE